MFSERDEELKTAMTPSEYLKALRYRTNADESLSARYVLTMFDTHPHESQDDSPASLPSANNSKSTEADEKDEKLQALDKPSVDPKHADVLQILSTGALSSSRSLSLVASPHSR